MDCYFEGRTGSGAGRFDFEAVYERTNTVWRDNARDLGTSNATGTARWSYTPANCSVNIRSQFLRNGCMCDTGTGTNNEGSGYAFRFRTFDRRNAFPNAGYSGTNWDGEAGTLSRFYPMDLGANEELGTSDFGTKINVYAENPIDNIGYTQRVEFDWSNIVGWRREARRLGAMLYFPTSTDKQFDDHTRTFLDLIGGHSDAIIDGHSNGIFRCGEHNPNINPAFINRPGLVVCRR
jgi:hypothetical protein